MYKNIKLIIFDLDGTLVDAYPAITRSFNFTMGVLGYTRQAPGVIRRAVGWGDENLLKPFIKKKDLNRAVRIYRRHHQDALIKYSRLLPQATAVLKMLREKGFKLAVASNRPTKFSWIIIRSLGLEKYFDYVICADRLKYGKPHPQILNNILRKFSLKSKQALYIGDMTIDAQAGRRAKIKTIIVTTGSSHLKEIKREGPFRIITGISELLKSIQKPCLA